MPRRAGYNIVRMTEETRRERDRLIGQILDAVRALYDQRLIRHSDLIVAQDELAPQGASTTQIANIGFFATHPTADYRLEVTLVVREEDR